MASNFFTNQGENTLYNKFAGVFEHMKNIEYFKSVIGYFRASGYFVIRKHFPNDLKVKIIAGINVDPFIALAQKQGLLFNLNAKDTKEAFIESIQDDILSAKYGKDIEEGILQLIGDIADGRIEIRAHNSKKLHSKFYIFLSPNFNEHNPNGMVIMGSSNLSAQGLGLEDVQHNYEMNVELRDYENVKFADTEFEKLWEQSTAILPIDAPALIKKTYLDATPTPFELFVKFLIEFFGKNIEYDPDSISDIPLKKFKKLSYQIDAVNQGYELLLKYNGFFLADVVGTGKTVMAALLAKKFIIQNGPKTKVLVVYPPTLEKNWKSTFKEFRIDEKCHFIANGSLNKIVEGDHNYADKERYECDKTRKELIADFKYKFSNADEQDIEIIVDEKLEVLYFEKIYNPEKSTEITFLKNIIRNELITRIKRINRIEGELNYEPSEDVSLVFDSKSYLGELKDKVDPSINPIINHLFIIRPNLFRKMKEDGPLPINHSFASKDFLTKVSPHEFDFLKTIEDHRVHVSGYTWHEKIIYSKERQLMMCAIDLLRECRKNFYSEILPVLIKKEKQNKINEGKTEAEIKSAIIKKIPLLSAIATDKHHKKIKTAYKGETGCMDKHCEYSLLQEIFDDIDRQLVVYGTLYVTLEPCNKRGYFLDGMENKPKIPCAVRCVEAGISNIYIGTHDPDAKVNWKGAKTLKTGCYEFELDKNRKPIGNEKEKLAAELLMQYFIDRGYFFTENKNFKIFKIGNPVKVNFFHPDLALEIMKINKEFIGHRVPDAYPKFDANLFF